MTTSTESDLDRLEQYLDHPERAEVTLPLDAVQGLFAAIACASPPVSRAKWLPAILGISLSAGGPEDIEPIARLLERFAEDTARQLNEGEGFDFILYGGEDEDFSTWADGYLAGVDLIDPPWEEEAEAEDLDKRVPPTVKREGPKVGRNDPCPCGSGRKYKSCHGR